MFVISGDAPGAEFSKEAMTEIEAAGVLESNRVDENVDNWTTPHNSQPKIEIA